MKQASKLKMIPNTYEDLKQSHLLIWLLSTRHTILSDQFKLLSLFNMIIDRIPFLCAFNSIEIYMTSSGRIK